MGNGGQGGGASTGGQPATGAGGTGQGDQVADALAAWSPIEPATAVKSTDGKLVGEAPVKVDTPPVDAPPVAEPASGEGEPPPVDSPEVAAIRAQMKVMQDNYDKLVANLGKGPQKIEETPVVTPPASEKFIATQEEMDKVLDKPENLDGLLTKVHNRAVESILKVVPAIVDNLVKTQLSLRTSVSDFYDTNKDLVPHKQFVGFVVNDLIGKNPDWKLDKVFEELPKEVRKRIGLKQQTDAAGGTKKGGFAPRGSGARPPATHSKALTGLEEEIADLVNMEDLK